MVDRIQEAHIPRHINVQRNILKFKSSLFREDAMGEVELAGGKGVSVQFMQIYRRSREVGQSYLTSVETTLLAMSHASWLMIRIRPQVVLCNGPGTCVPLCIIAFLFKIEVGPGYCFQYHVP
ncbi:hypothetical protein NC652_006833 [Populus alba x Populus x berolinensis]|nr:hypothetical protein NC652_006833 [Populus alba x Populus x berolinensis]